MTRYRARSAIAGAVMLGYAGAAVPLAAQDRLPSIATDQLTEAQRKSIDDYQAARHAEVSGPFIPLLRSPEVMSRTRAMGDYLRYNSALPPKLSEFVILMAARQWSQAYEWSVHAPIALQAGVDPDAVKAIGEGRRPERLGADEQVLYDFSQELFAHQSVSDATYGKMTARFGEKGVIDTVGIMGYYSLLAMVMNVSRTPPQPGGPVIAPLPR